MFDGDSTTDDVLDGVDLTGRRILVTGVSAGLGVETARALAAHGATVIGAARDLAKARRATGIVREQARSPQDFSIVEVDLASLASVRACADALVSAGKPLDLIIANAGVMGCPYGRTADGFETQFGTNHLGHFVLVNRLAPLLPTGGRVVILSSSGHRVSDIDLDDPNFDQTPYSPWVAYGRAKTANALFAVGFDARHRARRVRAAAVHPGVIHTELMRYATPDVMAQLPLNAAGRRLDEGLHWKSIPQGAATTVWAGVVAPAEAVGGQYCEDCHVAEVRDGSDGSFGVRRYALDPARADALWAKSEMLVGEHFESLAVA